MPAHACRELRAEQPAIRRFICRLSLSGLWTVRLALVFLESHPIELTGFVGLEIEMDWGAFALPRKKSTRPVRRVHLEV
jgi:hypothetical protein